MPHMLAWATDEMSDNGDKNGHTLFERHEKQAFFICENKASDQLRGDREAGQRLCFRYIASTIPLLPKYKISSL